MVNFSNNHDKCYSAYRWTSKDDDSVHHSQPNPNLDDVASSRRKKSTQAYGPAIKSYAQENLTNSLQKKKEKATSRKRPTQFKVTDFSWTKNIYRDTELLYEGNKRKEERQTDLVAFVLSRSSISLNDLIENTLKRNNAKASIECEKQLEWLEWRY